MALIAFHQSPVLQFKQIKIVSMPNKVSNFLWSNMCVAFRSKPFDFKQKISSRFASVEHTNQWLHEGFH
jgi:hypothetical protein